MSALLFVAQARRAESSESANFSLDIGGEGDHGCEADCAWTGRRLRFHDLRHSYATWLVDDGVPPNWSSESWDTSASTTLDLYTRRTDDATRILRALDDEDPDDGPGGALVPA